ncbi:unnamed protein product [Closterium sp. NIES-53]
MKGSEFKFKNLELEAPLASPAMSPVQAARALVAALGLCTLAAVVHTCLTDGSPFRWVVLTPWMRATLVDFYVNVALIGVCLAAPPRCRGWGGGEWHGREGNHGVGVLQGDVMAGAHSLGDTTRLFWKHGHVCVRGHSALGPHALGSPLQPAATGAPFQIDPWHPCCTRPPVNLIWHWSCCRQ